MYTRIHAVRTIAADRWPAIEVFVGEPGRWLPAPAQFCPPDGWRIEVHAGGLHRGVIASLGEPWTLPDAYVRSLGWHAVAGHGELQHASRTLPGFEGRLTLRIQDTGAPTLEAAGHYVPPGGRLGAAADAAILHRVADHTIRLLVEEVADRLADASHVLHS